MTTLSSPMTSMSWPIRPGLSMRSVYGSSLVRPVVDTTDLTRLLSLRGVSAERPQSLAAKAGLGGSHLGG